MVLFCVLFLLAGPKIISAQAIANIRMNLRKKRISMRNLVNASQIRLVAVVFGFDASSECILGCKKMFRRMLALFGVNNRLFSGNDSHTTNYTCKLDKITRIRLIRD